MIATRLPALLTGVATMLVALAATAGAASAASVIRNGTSVRYTADPGESNQINVTISDSRVVIQELGHAANGDAITIRNEQNCTISGAVATCVGQPTDTRFLLDDMGDEAHVVNSSTYVPPIGDIGLDLSGGLGNDTLEAGNGSFNRVSGGGGNDTIRGGDTDRAPRCDFAYYCEFDELLEGDAGSDKIYGNNGDDYIVDPGDYESGDYGKDPAHNDTVFGGAGNDQLEAKQGTDALDGGPGQDQLEATESVDDTGLDQYKGGTGTDKLTIGEPLGIKQIVSLAQGITDVVPVNNGRADPPPSTVGGIENVDSRGNLNILIGDGAPNILGAYGKDGRVMATIDNIIVGCGGNDTLSTYDVQGARGRTSNSALADSMPYACGDSNSNDTFIGGHGSTSFAGGRGKDTVDYSAGPCANLVVDADGAYDDGSGCNEAVPAHDLDNDGKNDRDNVGRDVEVIKGSNGPDTLTGSGFGSELWGNDGDDKLQAGGGANELYGGVGNDTLLGAGGKDSMNGATGNDFLRGGNGDDRYDGGFGADNVSECYYCAGVPATGNDTFYVYDSPSGLQYKDTIGMCGTGADKVIGDRFDVGNPINLSLLPTDCIDPAPGSVTLGP